MDILVNNVYLCRMFARVITMLAIFALTVITTVASAHAARMSAVPEQTTRFGEMTYASGNKELSCDGEQHCGSADAGMCDFVCTGLSAFLTSPGEQAAHEYGPASHDTASRVVRAGRAPGIDERPPKLRLL